MTPDTYSTGISGRAPEPPALRCADAARMRGEPLLASAVRHRRFLLLEVPGPWGASALDEKYMDAEVARRLRRAAADADAHVLLIRRPGRQAMEDQGAGGRPMAWAFVDTSAEAKRVLWGSWRDRADLLGRDLTEAISSEANSGLANTGLANTGLANTAGPQRLALVCTNGRRDQCCAIRGRPVAAVIEAATDWDTWECSHLGGHRFAATIMLLPTGDMFGRLDEKSAPEVLRSFDAGLLSPDHYRGRCGQPAPAQAALHAAAVRLADFRRDAFEVSSARPAPGEADRWEVEVVHRAERGPGTRSPRTAYRVIIAESVLAPHFLSCSDDKPKPQTRYDTLSFSPID
jgi:hypothetical protein